MRNSINTITDLNRVTASFGSIRPELIGSLLADKKLIVSVEIAKLLADKVKTQ